MGPDQKHALKAHWRKWVFPSLGVDRPAVTVGRQCVELTRAAVGTAAVHEHQPMDFPIDAEIGELSSSLEIY
jgi:hypothetical protein